MAAVPVPAPAPSFSPLANPVVVLGSQYLADYPVDLILVEKLMTLADGTFTVMDVKGNVMFKVKGKIISLHDRRTLLDASDNPIISLHKKLFSLHSRWFVYKGESSDPKDLLFTAKQSSIIQFKTELDVFLGADNKEEKPDFKVKGSFLAKSCIIYLGDGSTIIAQMHKKHTVQSELLGKDSFAVTVYPKVDYAFIVALVVILNEINDAADDN